MTNVNALMDMILQKGDLSKVSDEFDKLLPSIDRDTRERLTNALEKAAYYISPQKAQEIVSAMVSYGEHWSKEDVSKYIAQKGVPQEQCMQYYLVMNMAYNDYKQVADEFHIDEPAFYFALAKSFIDDPDGKPLKVEKYFQA